MRAFRVGLAAATLLALPASAVAEPVLLIAIDGLRPLDVIDAEKRGLVVPNLKKFVTDGSYATGVKGVLPTVTYPSHATLLTGAAPARHGIVSNNSFDPLQINQGGWFWYASDIKVPTLWDAARGAGHSTANVHWPVSVGAKAVDWNLPQYWRTGHADDAKLLASLATPGLLPDLETAIGPYAPGIDESIGGDENRGRFAERIIAEKSPYFMTVYLTALDHEQHAEGPGSAKANAILERIDAIVGRLVATQLSGRPDSVVAVVSDHGFEQTTTEVNFFRAFVDAGLITLADGKIASWEASPWPSGGSVAVMLARQDAALEKRVAEALARMKADPAMKIRTIADRAQIEALGGNPAAAFFINLAPEAVAGGFASVAGPTSAPSKYRGMHGYFPDSPNLRSTFMVMGRAIPKGRSLGEVDMRAIAPTLARIMAVPLPAAEVAAISVKSDR